VKRFQTDPQVGQLLQNFVPLKVDAKSDDFQTLARQYKPPGNGIPMMYVIGANGAELDKISGAPKGDGLNTFLARSLSRAALAGPGGLAGPAGGGAPDEEPETSRPVDTGPTEAEIRAKERRLQTLIRRAQNFAAKGDFAAASGIVGPLMEDPETPASNELDQLVVGLKQKAGQAITAADGRRESGQLLLAAVAVVEAERMYGPLPSVKPELATARDAIAESSGGETALRQAEAVDIARAAEADRDLEGAIKAYEAVVEAFPNTQVAQMAEVRGKQLAAARPANTGGDLEKAQSMFTMAQAIAERDPNKAKKYLVKVIEIAPQGSGVSGDASAMLRGLQ